MFASLENLKSAVNGFIGVTSQTLKQGYIDLATISTLKITAFEMPQRPSDSTNGLFASAVGELFPVFWSIASYVNDVSPATWSTLLES